MASPLEDIIRNRIQMSGAINIAQYMDLCLSHPDWGYYQKQDPFGSGGDFITAPEISQMFGEMIGIWALSVWQQMGSPDVFNLVELGPGRSTLMLDALRAAKNNDAFIGAARICLVETSPCLKKRQLQTLKDYHVHQVRDVKDIPDGPVIVIANEFFDALPIRQFEKTVDGWRERMVGLDEKGHLCFQNGADASIHMAAKTGSVMETSEAGIGVIRDLSQRINTFSGAALIIDYGYSGPAFGDTFQALYRHRFENPLIRPGDQDLTAHVDFSGLKTAAEKAGIKVTGPVTQSAFLSAMGIQARAQMLRSNATMQQKKDIQSALERLLDPEQMGDLFKVMAMTDQNIRTVAGF